jgi:hypothetical protein
MFFRNVDKLLPDYTSEDCIVHGHYSEDSKARSKLIYPFINYILLWAKGWKTGIRFLTGLRNSSIPHNVHISFGTHEVSYPMDNVVPFPWG